MIRISCSRRTRPCYHALSYAVARLLSTMQYRYLRHLLRFAWNKFWLIFRDLLTFRVDTRVAQIKLGYVEGKMCYSVLGKPYFSFQGIPYAKPPVGHLRFKQPEPPEPWEGVRDAKREASVCIQYDYLLGMVIGSEDCLYLNVYVPATCARIGGSNKDWDLKSVLVWIHGGGFEMGSSRSDYYSPDFFLEEDVILVTMNYRLGALGFLSTGTEDAPGNAGLKDMVMALKWVKENIEELGGDPDRVCIFGESAGGAAVHYLMLSDLSKGLFSCAISQSGSALAPYAFATHPVRTAFKLGHVLGCDTNDPKVLVEHLRSLPAKVLAKRKNEALSEENRRELISYAFVPCAEPVSAGAFITCEPETLLQEGHFHQVPYITGCNQLEGMLSLQKVLESNPSWSELDKDFESLVPRCLNLERGSAKRTRVADLMREFYLDKRAANMNTYAECCDLLTDTFYLEPMHRITEYMTKDNTSAVYNYYFLFDGTREVLKPFLGVDLPGPTHADEIAYLFYMPILAQNLNSETPEMRVTKQMARMWSNFAKTRNPTPDESDPLLQTTWKPAGNTSQYYLRITNELQLESSYEWKRMKFWGDMHRYSKTDTDT